MKHTKNMFGSGDLYSAEDLQGKVYIEAAACTSLYAEALSWANANSDRIVKDPKRADEVVLLSCQVTDLAVLNDLRRLEALKKEHGWGPARFWICGCLARRFDIELPDRCRRLDHIRVDYQDIADKSLVTFAPPFWIEHYYEGLRSDDDGYRMREQYPLRIGVGCAGKCSYCTIRVTRGKPYKLDNHKLFNEFMHHDDVILISDNPSVDQIKWWCDIAIGNDKPISIRNVEPAVAMKCWQYLWEAVESRVLSKLHVPIQSVNPATLKEMGRDPDKTMHFIARAQTLRGSMDFKLLTNIIIDDKTHKHDIECVNMLFDSVSWNPMWDGTWDRKVAEKRFKKYFPWS